MLRYVVRFVLVWGTLAAVTAAPIWLHVRQP